MKIFIQKIKKKNYFKINIKKRKKREKNDKITKK